MPLGTTDLVVVLDSLLEGLQVLGGPELRYLHVNETAARHGRTTKAALIGHTMSERYPGIERTELHAILLRCLADRTSHTMENAFTFPDETVGHFELRIEPVPQGVSVLSIDITQRKNAELAAASAEARLQHAQRMDAIGQLAAGIAHDFNNLITVALGQAEVALARAEGPTRADMETVLEAARASSQLTRQLLAYGRSTALAREPIDPREIVTALEPLLRRALGDRISLVTELGATGARVLGDRTQLQQIVMNLVLNARDAIPGDGRITVSIARDVSGDARAHPGGRDGPHVVIAVTDTGSGMDEETRARIFEPFFSTKEKGRGTGLGLSTVYGIAKQHGGNVWVYSELGEGTTFKVYLPEIDERAARPERASARPLAPATPEAGGAILVADDSPLLCRLIEAVLGGAGHRVLVASTGDDALALWDREPAGAIAMLVTDMRMPGMTGAELIDAIRARRPGLPVIATSGYPARHLAEMHELPEGVTFVEKPFAPSALLAQVRALHAP